MKNSPHVPSCAHVVITGRVQGVGYRYFAQARALEHGLVGWVRNLPKGDVECLAEGTPSAIEAWIEQLKKGPPLSRVKAVNVVARPPTDQYSDFVIEG